MPVDGHFDEDKFTEEFLKEIYEAISTEEMSVNAATDPKFTDIDPTGETANLNSTNFDDAISGFTEDSSNSGNKKNENIDSPSFDPTSGNGTHLKSCWLTSISDSYTKVYDCISATELQECFSGINISDALIPGEIKSDYVPSACAMDHCRLEARFQLSNSDFCNQVLIRSLDQSPWLPTQRPTDLGTDIAFMFFLTAFVLPLVFKMVRCISFIPFYNTRIDKKKHPIVYGIFFFIAWCVALGASNWNVFAMLWAFVQRYLNSE